MSTATTAQIARVARIYKEIAGTGSRITVRKLSGGRLRVTEYAAGEKAYLVLDRDGHYAP